MNAENQEALKQALRDVHLPPEVSWWPPAPIWWFIAAILTGLLSYGIYCFVRYQVGNRYKRTATNELMIQFSRWKENQSNATYAIQYVTQANQIIRRCVLHAKHSQSSIGGSSEQWKATLNEFSTSGLSPSSLKVLTEECYKPSPSINVPQLHDEVLTWVKKAKPSKTSSQSNNELIGRQSNV